MTEHDPIDHITRTRLLTATRAHTTDLVLDQVENVIVKMRRDYRGNALTENLAIGYIAELTALYEIIELIDSEAKKVIHAEEIGRTGTAPYQA